MGEQTPEQQMLACVAAMNQAHATNAETVTLRMDGLRVFIDSLTRATARLQRIETAARELAESMRFLRVPPPAKLEALRKALEES